jgi:5'-deoxynucleotidase YfbR-like HD superfamily hydrolase
MADSPEFQAEWREYLRNQKRDLNRAVVQLSTVEVLLQSANYPTTLSRDSARITRTLIEADLEKVVKMLAEAE